MEAYIVIHLAHTKVGLRLKGRSNSVIEGYVHV